VALDCSRKWSLYHLDVKSTFLNDPLEELVFVAQSLGFEIKGKEDKLYRLHKTLDDLKHVPWACDLEPSTV
jgi:hypothetical protein